MRSPDPSSPDAASTLTPSSAASAKAWSMAFIAWAVQPLSAAPQLMEMTEGFRLVLCTALVIASRKPRSVFGAK